ncbi:MAG: efflux RND transporter permease subunit [SAR202 cluster bacterium]|nr:efflux RND transporter permease subunit [SAR202 cluster bacterium]MDP7103253.1 efflux RND transporter permease subunit [SAR202 cluster bacterium]MDP7224832.1 efflux RND transporter permease subunit [SAR202 cluster bacterium]HJO81944.1 efflux RND transporter permease subunit [SAR202 cluster bacterium]
MSFLTGLALRRRSVTVLIILLVLGGGLATYMSLQVELFPEIEFPLVTVMTFYPSANPDAVASDVTQPIESAISGTSGVKNVQSISSESVSMVLANFTFGTDMAEAERTISGRVGSLTFPTGVNQPRVARIDPDAFPVMQLSVLADRDIAEIQQIVESVVLPPILGIDGVFDLEITGGVDRQILVEVDPERMSEFGLSMFQVGSALGENNVAAPSGAVTENGQTLPVRTMHTYRSLEELNELVVGFAPSPGQSGSPAPGAPQLQPVKLSDVAEVSVGAGPASSVSRTNGRPSLGIGVLKEPEANTVEVAKAVLAAIESLDALPADVEVATIFNDGPQIQEQIDTLQREALFGFLFALAVVFAFLITLRPTIWKGLTLTLRPTLVIGLSIPLSIFTGILIMGSQGMSLNFMTLGGLAISVGRVVDDSIVVLENVYRHVQRGEDRFEIALKATREVAPAIIASTLTTIVVFVPLGFIQGLVGAFFLPFALTISFALGASLIVALTAVPVVGALLVRPGDMPDSDEKDDGEVLQETWIHRAYTPVLVFALDHKAIALITALVATVASVGLMAFIPISLFPAGGERFLTIDMTMPSGTSIERTFEEVDQIEGVLQGLAAVGDVESYMTTVGNPESGFQPGGGAGAGGASRANILVRASQDAPEDITDQLRETLESEGERRISISEIGAGPPSTGLEVRVTGADQAAIAKATTELVAEFSRIDGIIDVTSNIAESKDEVVIDVDPTAASALGLSARAVAFQVGQHMIGQVVTQLELEGASLDVRLLGRPDSVDSIDKISQLTIVGPMGVTALEDVASVSVEQGPVTISRSDEQRSASITGGLTSDDTQAIGAEVQRRVDAIDLPPGVEVVVGGIFQEITEGFQDIFKAMAIGVVLVYLVMAASLGALRNPFVIVMSLPLAIIGALAALAVTGRALGLPAMMGFLLLIGIVVTNAIVLIAFVEQMRESGRDIREALVLAGRVRLRPILMTGFTTSFALIPLAAFASESGGIIGAEMATVVIGGLVSSTALTLIVIPVVYTLMHSSIPGIFRRTASDVDAAQA